MRVLPVPSMSALNIFNIRELLEKLKDECELGTASIFDLYLASGNKFLQEQLSVLLLKWSR